MDQTPTGRRTNGGGTQTLRRGPERRVWTKAGPVDTALLIDEDVELGVEREELTTAEPAALALFGFAIGTFIISWPLSTLAPDSALYATVAPVLVFAGIVQFLCGLVAFRRGNTFAGTAFGAYGANNVVVATFFLLQAAGVVPTASGTPSMKMLALELFCFAFVSLVLMIGAMRLNVAFVLVLFALVPGFSLAGIGDLAGVDPVVGQIGGFFLMASASFAAYAAAALVLNSTWERNVLPLGSLAK